MKENGTNPYEKSKINKRKWCTLEINFKNFFFYFCMQFVKGFKILAHIFACSSNNIGLHWNWIEWMMKDQDINFPLCKRIFVDYRNSFMQNFYITSLKLEYYKEKKIILSIFFLHFLLILVILFFFFSAKSHL